MEPITFKVVMIGDARVGKTSLLIRFAKNSFDPKQPSTIQASYLERVLQVESQTVRLQIYDSAGQERFRSLTPIYYRGADGVVLACDCTDRTSFDKLPDWDRELKKFVENPECCYVSAGNKCDLSTRIVVDQEVLESLGHPSFMTSAKTPKNVKKMFLCLVQQMMRVHRAKMKARASTVRALPGSASVSGSQPRGATTSGGLRMEEFEADDGRRKDEQCKC